MTDETTDQDASDDAPSETVSTESARPDVRDATGDEPTPQDGASDTAGERDDQIPLADLAGRVAARRERSSGDTDQADELFEEVHVTELDSEDVWTALAEDGVEDTGEIGAGADAKPVEVADGFSDHIVPKNEFCQRCEHLADPPTLSCRHEGTAIVEVVDGEQFRVRNCPMVEDDD